MTEVKMPSLSNIAMNVRGLEEIKEKVQVHLDLKSLNQRHQQALRLYVQGYTTHEVEKMCGFTYGYVRKLLATPLAQEKLAELNERMDASAVEGVKAMKLIFQEEAPNLALHLVKKAYEAEKDGDQISATVKALQFAQEGVVEEQRDSPAIVIKVGEKEVDIFEGAFARNGDAEDAEVVDMVKELGDDEPD